MLSSQWEETREWMEAQLLCTVSQAWGVCRTNPFALISFAGGGVVFVCAWAASSFVQKVHSGAPAPRDSVCGHASGQAGPGEPWWVLRRGCA